ncbi:MAG: hypothetical protein FWE53_03025 [Firmicutes bacterium]|nr:hypothetical protein [Bacillota bacterium]
MNNFKLLARQAKQRMKKGYWQAENKARSECMERGVSRGAKLERISDLYAQKLERELYRSETLADPDEALYKKVCQILDENEYVLNPIKYLIDHESYDSLDVTAKQNYIFKLADKYNRLKERYMEEREIRKNIV